MILIVINLGIPRGITGNQVPNYLRESLSVIQRGASSGVTRVQLTESQLPQDLDTDQFADVVQSFSSSNFKVGITR